MFNKLGAGHGLIMDGNTDTDPSLSGQIHWDGAHKRFIISDPLSAQSTTFHPYNHYLSLDPDIMSVINWAKDKREEERLMKEKVDNIPAVREAYEHFQTILALSK